MTRTSRHSPIKSTKSPEEESSLLLPNSRHSQGSSNRNLFETEEHQSLRSNDEFKQDFNITSDSESHFSDAEDLESSLPTSSGAGTRTGTERVGSFSESTRSTGITESIYNSLYSTQSVEESHYPSLNTVEGSLAQIPNNINHNQINDINNSIENTEINENRSPEELELQTRTPAPPPNLSYQQRLVNTVHSFFSFRQTYDRLSNGITTGRLQANTPGRFIGLGTDGVFRNLAAKPDRELEILSRELHPPTYEEAAADSAPEYWEIGVVNPVFEDEVFVRGLPVGTFGNLIWNAIMTIAFKMVAFILCYLLHTSHAAKEGTRVGFGAMLIMYGYNILPTNFGSPDRIPPRLITLGGNDRSLVLGKTLSVEISGVIDTYVSDIAGATRPESPSFNGTHELYMAYGVIAFGIFTILQAFVSFYQVKQDERKMLAPPPEQPHHSTTEAVYDVPE